MLVNISNAGDLYVYLEATHVLLRGIYLNTKNIYPKQFSS